MTELPDKMRAVLLTGHGGLDKLVLRDDVPVPRPGRGEVVVRVRAAALNNTDINTRTAWYSDKVTDGITQDGGTDGFAEAEADQGSWGGQPLTFPRIQGADVCGKVAAVGDGVDPARIGQRVIIDGWIRHDLNDIENWDYFGSELNGGFAQFTKVPAENAHALVCDLSDVELASFPCAYATSENMVDRPRVGEGDQVLITGASGGVGSAAIQLCKRRGATVIAMASEAKHDQLVPLGADHLLPRSVADLEATLRPLTGDGRVDVVLDVVGGDGFPLVVDRLRPGGRYSSAGAISGPSVAFNLRNLIYRDLEFYGATCLQPRVFGNLVGYIERGEVRPVIGAVFPMEEIHAAQELFITKQKVGKIVLTVD